MACLRQIAFPAMKFDLQVYTDFILFKRIMPINWKNTQGLLFTQGKKKYEKLKQGLNRLV